VCVGVSWDADTDSDVDGVGGDVLDPLAVWLPSVIVVDAVAECDVVSVRVVVRLTLTELAMEDDDVGGGEGVVEVDKEVDSDGTNEREAERLAADGEAVSDALTVLRVMATDLDAVFAVSVVLLLLL
jgi:hypothetical protein